MLGKVKREDQITIFSKFLVKKFEIGGRKVFGENLKQVFEIANNITGDIQQLCEALWEVTILFQSGKEIRFVNPFFKAWLLPRGR